MNTYEKIEKARDDFETKAERVRNNKDLSQSGKEKALQALNSEKRDALKVAVKELRKQAVAAAIKADKLSGAQWALGQIEAERLDYGRLAFEAQAVQSALVLAGDDPWKVTELWRRTKASNDTYKIRAWLDVVPASIPEKTIHASTWQELKADFVQSVDLTHSAKMADWESERRGHLEELTDLSKAAAVIAEELGTRGNPNSNVMARVFEGIELERSGELKVDFGGVKLTKDEKPDETFKRLESEYAERVNQQAATFQAFGKEYDPLEDGVG
jgi:hypothetical protein